jgi:diadenosine tetraphosphate (Ap4A) HIT family hydrolase
VTRQQPRFQRYIGIDYSGAEVPTASLKGLRVYMAGASPAVEVPPRPSPRRYWTRQEIAEWLVERLREDIPTIIGIDHGFSFPLQYFEHHKLPLDWPAFLDDFQKYWPTDHPHTYVDFVRDNNPRSGNSRWRRLTELQCRAKSVFQFDVQGSVAKSTHSGIPWLRYIRHEAGQRVHFWPFDGWDIPEGKSVIAEIYPALWNRSFPRKDRDPHQHDAFCVAETLRRFDMDGTLQQIFTPDLTEQERGIAAVEGWILGVVSCSEKGALPTIGCHFCERSRSGVVIAKNDLAVAFADAYPISEGHTLIVPLRHEADFFSLSEAEQRAMLSLARSVQRRLHRKHAPDGYNVGINIGKAGGQTVDHVHLHVIPRYSGDVEDPRGGVRWVIPAKARYWSGQ